MSEFTNGRFYEVLDDHTADPNAVTRAAVLGQRCITTSPPPGRNERLAHRDHPARTVLPVARRAAPAGVLSKYWNCREWVGAGRIAEHGRLVVRGTALRAMNFLFEYVGRDAGEPVDRFSHHVHEREQKLLVDGAFAAKPSGPTGPGWCGLGELTANGANGEHSPTKPKTNA
ncbi:MAG: hypothetical protein U0792_05760 [Gemmataceae bacterium]